MNKLNREPVGIWNALVAPILMAAVLLFGWSEETTGVVQAVILAVTGLLATTGIRTDGFWVALTGFAKAVLALLLTFNVNVNDDLQTFILSVITIVSAAVVERPQVEAKVLPLRRPAQPNSEPPGDWDSRVA